jgi:hypothetical protein
MSRKICIQFEIRDILIMKDTLKQMGHDFVEKGQDIVQIQRSYHPIEFNAQTGEVSYDEMHVSEVDKIKQQYMLNFFKDRAIKEGNSVRETKLANGDIELYLLN